MKCCINGTLVLNFESEDKLLRLKKMYRSDSNNSTLTPARLNFERFESVRGSSGKQTFERVDPLSNYEDVRRPTPLALISRNNWPAAKYETEREGLHERHTQDEIGDARFHSIVQIYRSP